MPKLIVASLIDEHALAVMSALAAQGAGPVELLDLSGVPTRLTVSISFEDSARRLELRRAGRGLLDLEPLDAVWWRRSQPLRLPPGMTDQAHRRFALSEFTTSRLEILPSAVEKLRRLGWFDDADQRNDSAIAGAVVGLVERAIALRLGP